MSEKIDIFNLLLSSGPVVKFVLILLIVASILSWTIVFRKKIYLRKMKASNGEFLDLFNSSTDLNEIIREVQNLPYSFCGNIFSEGCDELVKMQDSLGQSDFKSKVSVHFGKNGLENIKRAIKKGSIRCHEKMDTLLSTLASIGSVSPFIGLFGTVWGIINSFTGLSAGGGSLESVAPGIAEALVATAMGLAAAIPAVWFFNSIGQQNQVMVARLESFEQELLNLIERTFISEEN